jgi:hypothetical protein
MVPLEACAPDITQKVTTSSAEARRTEQLAMKIRTVARPYVLTFHTTGQSYALTSADAQRLLDEYPAVSATSQRVVLPGHNTSDPKQRCTLQPATRGGGAAFIIEKENTMSESPVRPLYEIAREIRKDWKRVYFGAVPYLDAMASLDKITDDYGADSAVSVVIYFLSNATTWRGEVARRVKAELKSMTKGR